MTHPISELIELGGPALGLPDPALPAASLDRAGAMADELSALLDHKNGFYAFESALRVLPARSCGPEIGLVEWNYEKLWIDEYRGMADGLLFFAEDVFGGQFCIRADGVYQFDPETARTEKLASSLEGWADALLHNYKVLTGHPLAHEWQRLNGQLPSGIRLVPKRPFIAGGEFSVQNLFPLDAATSMRWRASIAVQIKDLPDGAQIRLKVLD